MRYEKLILDVWTDGRVEPDEALKTAGGQRRFPLFADAPIEIQPVLAAVQRQMGFVITNRMIQSRNIIAGDVGRVAEEAFRFLYQ